MSADERRIARDGSNYTLREFLDWYGDERGHQYWQKARVACAPQPGVPGALHPVGQDAPHPGVLAAGAPQAAAKAAAAPAVQPTGTVGALQSGGNPVNQTRRRVLAARGVTHVVASGGTLALTLVDGEVVLYE